MQTSTGVLRAVLRSQRRPSFEFVEMVWKVGKLERHSKRKGLRQRLWCVGGCARCPAPATSRCGRCNAAAYCGAKCQQADWSVHRASCDAQNAQRLGSAVSNKHKRHFGPLSPPPRLLLGPGPSNAHPRVLAAFTAPQTGHMDPTFLTLMDETMELLRYAWQTENPFTIPVSGTGSAAMEACFANLIEEGDKVLVASMGYFGERMIDMAKRYGADVHAIRVPWGQVFSLEELKAAIETHKPALFALVHAETSTGALQPVKGLGEICRANNALLILDTVTSLGGVPIFLDDWLVDAAYSGAQKCLNCPPGVSPLTFGPRAMSRLLSRKGPVKNWYLDMSMIAKYVLNPDGSAGTPTRSYHHTAPIVMNYALREALALLAEESLEVRWQKHQVISAMLYAELENLGLKLVVAPEHRLAPLTTVYVPAGVDAKAVTSQLLTKYNIEIGGGLGELAGKAWRIGLMGFNARPENVRLLIGALADILRRQGYAFPASA
eukprot:TRINITY_DN3170_c0_g1_i1.p1 TRINITY_DN3170_c0_g1~~TRINITY_DN3170_c0_g1_i1.p1  ORF type:complete len:492 (+),score=67.44 TRINITY_DN3170_c0_g1_i1:954-2429(+)